MFDLWSNARRQWRDGVNVLLGAWLIISPWVLGYGSGRAAWNAFIVGMIVMVVALSVVAAFQQWEEWVSLAAGIWLVISPWLMGVASDTAVVWNQMIVGAILAALAAWSAFFEHRPFAT